MGACDMCGKEGSLLVAMIEGVQLSVCNACARHGKILKKEKPKPKKFAKARPKEEKEVVQLIVKDYDKRIRKAREKLGMSQKEFAQKINEKESILQKLETKQFKPKIELASKFEKMFNITLLETVEIEKEKKTTNEQRGPLTIGDLIKLK